MLVTSSKFRGKVLSRSGVDMLLPGYSQDLRIKHGTNLKLPLVQVE